MSDEGERPIDSLVPVVRRETVSRSNSLVGRGLALLEVRQPTEAETIEQIRERAIAGDASAQYSLGLMYADEWHFKEAEEWYRKAAVQQDGGHLHEYAYEHEHEARVAHKSAQQALNDLHDLGQFVPHDEARAAELYRKLADQGNASAQFGLAVSYKCGWGVQKDDAEFSKWLWKAANQGNADALALKGTIYSLEGPSQDYVQAHKWLSLAVSASSRDRKYNRNQFLDEIAAKMTPQQIAEAQKLASEWKPTK